MAGTPKNLIPAIGEELMRPCHPSSEALARAMAERHGETVAAVLFYGSCLRQDPGDEPPEGIQDFYVLLDRYRDAYAGRLAAIANRILPPNVFYIERPWQGRTVRAKYAVIALDQFRHGTSSRAFHPWLWARFSQPTALLFARDDFSRETVTAAVAEAVSTMLREAAPLAPSRPDERQLWLTALGLTYGTELRPESADRAALIYETDSARYDRMAHLVFGRTRAGGPIDTGADEPARRRARRRWRMRKALGKPLTVLRLMKSLFTFDGGVDYALWKVERHTGVRVPITSFERRHPLLTSPRLLWRVVRLSAVR